MTTTSSVTSSTLATPTVSTGNAQDVSNLTPGSMTISMAEAVTVKVQPYLDQATAVQTQISTNQTKLSAYQNMQSLLQALQSAAANLSTQALEGSNVFNSRVANLSASSTVSGGTPSSPNALMTASIATGTPVGSHTVVVNQLAAAEADISKTLSLSSTAALSTLSGFPASGSISIAETGKTAVPVTITSSMTLTDVAAAINAVSSQNGVTASVVSVSSTQSVLVLTGNDTNSPLTFGGDSSGILASLGVLSGGTPANQVTKAEPAVLTVDGVTGITRNTNAISDVLTGVTMNLTAADPNTIITLNVAPDTSSATSAVQALATAYNNWEAFVKQNEATNSDGSASSGAVLFGDSSLRDASLSVDSTITAEVRNLSLSSIGVSLDSNNNMQVNTTQLSQAISTNFAGVFSMFQSQATTDQTYLQAFGTDYASYNGPAFTLGVGTDSSGNPIAIGSGASNFAVSTTANGGYILSGVSGTAYAGMSFTFDAAALGSTANVTVSQGLANQVFSAAGQYGDPLTGSVENIVNSLQSEDQTLTSRYTTLTTEAQNYTNFLLTQYSAMSSKVASANQVYLTLQSILNAQNAKQ